MESKLIGIGLLIVFLGSILINLLILILYHKCFINNCTI